MRSLDDILAEYEFFDDKDDRQRLLIEIGRELEPMEQALKTDTTRVLGCLSNVWVYPTRDDAGRLHFQADSDSAITKGIIALILTMVQGRLPEDVLKVAIEDQLLPFGVEKHLTSRRTSGIPNMIALIRETAARYAET